LEDSEEGERAYRGEDYGKKINISIYVSSDGKNRIDYIPFLNILCHNCLSQKYITLQRNSAVPENDSIRPAYLPPTD
jgi:hypothetical protein